MDLSVKLGSLHLNNPVIAASGTFGYGLEYCSFVDLNAIGGFSTKGLSLQPKTGNPVPRVIETSSGMLNAIGLENIGLKVFLAEKGGTIPYEILCNVGKRVPRFYRNE